MSVNANSFSSPSNFTRKAGKVYDIPLLAPIKLRTTLNGVTQSQSSIRTDERSVTKIDIQYLARIRG